MLEENHAVQIANGADNVLLDGDGPGRAISLAGDEGLAAGCFGLMKAKAGSTPIPS